MVNPRLFPDLFSFISAIYETEDDCAVLHFTDIIPSYTKSRKEIAMKTVLIVVLIFFFVSFAAAETTRSIANLKKIVAALEVLERYGYGWLINGHRAGKERVKVLKEVFEKTEQVRRSSVEHLVAFAYDKDMRYLDHEVIATGSERTVEYDIADLLSFVHRTKAHSVVTAHNHPTAITAWMALDAPYPSAGDFKSTSFIVNEMRKCGVRLFDDVVLTRYKLFSMRIHHSTLWR